MTKTLSAHWLMLFPLLVGTGGCAVDTAAADGDQQGRVVEAFKATPFYPPGCRAPDLYAGYVDPSTGASGTTVVINVPPGGYSPGLYTPCPLDKTIASDVTVTDLIYDVHDEVFSPFLQFVDQCYANAGTTFYKHIKGRFPWAFADQAVWLSDGDDVTVSQTLFEYLLQGRRDVYDQWQADPQCPGAKLNDFVKNNYPDVYASVNFLRADVASRRAVSDFDGDARADYATYESSTLWNIRQSSAGVRMGYVIGGPNQLLAPGDYDGDGRTDAATFDNNTGLWRWIGSTSRGSNTAQFGQSGDIPVANDFDGDGQTDLAVWRPSNGTWYISSSAGAGVITKQWGTAGDIPVTGDYDGDGVADHAVWRPSQNRWWLSRSSDQTTFAIDLGNSGLGEKPVPGDYDGDGITDAAVVNPGNGWWTIRDSSTGVVRTVQWGTTGDVRAPNDYDGDSQTDIAVWRPSTSQWFHIRSSDGAQIGPPWGQSAGIPVSTAFLY